MRRNMSHNIEKILSLFFSETNRRIAAPSACLKISYAIQLLAALIRQAAKICFYKIITPQMLITWAAQIVNAIRLTDPKGGNSVLIGLEVVFRRVPNPRNPSGFDLNANSPVP
jgi:hypothetical protein